MTSPADYKREVFSEMGLRARPSWAECQRALNRAVIRWRMTQSQIVFAKLYRFWRLCKELYENENVQVSQDVLVALRKFESLQLRDRVGVVSAADWEDFWKSTPQDSVLVGVNQPPKSIETPTGITKVIPTQDGLGQPDAWDDESFPSRKKRKSGSARRKRPKTLARKLNKMTVVEKPVKPSEREHILFAREQIRRSVADAIIETVRILRKPDHKNSTKAQKIGHFITCLRREMSWLSGGKMVMPRFVNGEKKTEHINVYGTQLGFTLRHMLDKTSWSDVGVYSNPSFRLGLDIRYLAKEAMDMARDSKMELDEEMQKLQNQVLDMDGFASKMKQLVNESEVLTKRLETSLDQLED